MGWSNKDFAMAMEKIKEKLLKLDPENTNAHFFCALAVVWPNENIKSMKVLCMEI